MKVCLRGRYVCEMRIYLYIGYSLPKRGGEGEEGGCLSWSCWWSLSWSWGMSSFFLWVLIYGVLGDLYIIEDYIFNCLMY